MRIAHFSDLHLLSLDGVKVLDFANKRWIGGLNLLSNRGRHYHSHIFEAMVEDINAVGVDHAVCTGDLTNLAFEQEFHFARERFARMVLGEVDVTVIPGNHDTYVAVGADYFREIFSGYHQPDEPWHSEHAWPVVRIRGQVAIIGLSSSRKTPWFTAYGRIGEDQLSRLAAVLSDDRLAGMLRLVAIHHPPAGPAARNRIRGLRDWQAFGRVIAEHGAELIIHGHEHRDMLHQLEGPHGREVAVMGVQSGTYLANKPHRTARYRIFDIDDSPGDSSEDKRPRVTGHVLRVWDPGKQAFIEDPGDTARPAQV